METYDAHKSTTEIRQASRRLDNFWILIISTTTLIALFLIIYLVVCGQHTAERYFLSCGHASQDGFAGRPGRSPH